MPQEMLDARLYPTIPPTAQHMPAWCFYPMSKKRAADANWYTLPFEERKELMHEHGVSGRRFAGRIVQYITASTGLDDYEWGVTLFGVHPDDLKDVVYTMRFDQASAVYAEFGPFYTGMVVSVEELAALF
jgi:chlorite dismutase